MTYDHDITTQHVLDAMRESIEENRAREEREQMIEQSIEQQRLEMARLEYEVHRQESELQYRRYRQEFEAQFSSSDLERIKQMIEEAQLKRRAEKNHFEDDEDLFKL